MRGLLLWLGLAVVAAGAGQEKPRLSARELVRNLEKKSFTGERISIQFSNAGLPEFLARFHDISGLEFRLSPSLDAVKFPPRSYNFLGYAWDRALAAVLSDHGLSLRLKDDALWVDVFSPPKNWTFPAFLVGTATMAALAALFFWIKTRRKLRRRAQDRERRITLDSAAVEDAVQRLRFMFQVEKAYRNERMSLDSLAERLGFQPYQLSGIINSRLGKSFTEFVADYRMEEVKKRLADPAETSTILNIAYDAGFGTKASFNRIFKERTGLTPSEYRKKPASAK